LTASSLRLRPGGFAGQFTKLRTFAFSSGNLEHAALSQVVESFETHPCRQFTKPPHSVGGMTRLMPAPRLFRQSGR
jgi:hypothetical protein